MTVCTADRACILGAVANGAMTLSIAGRIVEACWLAIPEHVPHTRTGVCQIMPNHVHGIIEITKAHRKPRPCRGAVSPPASTRTTGTVLSHVRAGGETPPLHNVGLSDIVAFFKYQATKRINEGNGTPGRKIFQRSFYDHIVRDDTEHFFTEQYITLNPLMWSLDRNNPEVEHLTVDQIRRELREKCGLDDYAVERIVDQNAW